MDAETATAVLQSTVSVSIAFIVLNSFFTGLRLISRLLLKKQEFGWDDALVILGYIANLGFCTAALVIRHYEVWENPPADSSIAAFPAEYETRTKPALKAIYASEMFLYASTALPKLSILFLYLRVFDGKWFRITTWFLIGFTICYWLAFTFVAAFLCRPVAYFWDRLIPNGTCINIDAFWRVIPPFNISTDLATMIIPIPIVWKLQVSKMKKFGVILIFLTGGVGLVTCCVRWYIYFKYSALVITPHITAPLLNWAIVEGGTYLIAACLPVLRPVLLAIIPQRFLGASGSDPYRLKDNNHEPPSPLPFRMSVPWRNARSSRGLEKLPEHDNDRRSLVERRDGMKSPVVRLEPGTPGLGRQIQKRVDVEVMHSPAGDDIEMRGMNHATDEYAAAISDAYQQRQLREQKM